MANSKFKQKFNQQKKVIDLLDDEEGVVESEVVLRIPKSDIYSVAQVRTSIDNEAEESIIELGKSLEREQIQPIVVYPRDSRGYKIQKGERRWRGAMSNPNVTHLDAIVRKEGSILSQLTENIQRKDLSPFEIGRALLQIVDEQQVQSNLELAEMVNLSESRVSGFLKAVESPDYIEEAFNTGVIKDVESINSMRIAHNLDEQQTRELLDTVEPLSRHDTKAFTKGLKAEKKSAKKHLSEPKENKVDKVNHNASKGKITTAGVKSSPKDIRIKFEGQFGTIDLLGETQEGHIKVKLDDSAGAITVAASDVQVIGYSVR